MITIFVIGVALLLGVIGGLMPGVGSSIVLILVYPGLSNLNTPNLIIFYSVLVSTMQYYGSVAAIVFGVMGEPTSSPAVLNGHELYRRGFGEVALKYSALGSFVGSVLGVFVLYWLFRSSDVLLLLMTGKVKAVLLIVTVGILCVLSSNKFLGILFAVAGLILGGAGNIDVPFLTMIFPQYSVFDGGVPFLPIIIGLIAVPTMLRAMLSRSTIGDFDRDKQPGGPLTICKSGIPWALIRGSIIGCVSGCFPGVSYNASSNLSESVEKVINKGSDDSRALLNNLVSAETANNSGSIVVLAPLLIWAMPIVPSESILMGLLQQAGYNINVPVQSMVSIGVLCATLAVISVINLTISGVLYPFVLRTFTTINTYGYAVLIAICILIALMTGYVDHQLLMVVCLLTILIAVGYLIRDSTITMPFVFSFFVSSQLLPELYRQWLIFVS